jgi:hypothetical protein
MAVRTGHVTTRSARYSLGPGADLPIARVVVLVLIIVPLAAYYIASNQAKAPPSEEAKLIANFNPRQAFADNTPHFLPAPVAAVSEDENTAPAEPAPTDEPAQPETSGPVRVVNTGGIGVTLRAAPESGRHLATLRDGLLLDVLERKQIGDTEWLRVRTPDGTEGWIFARLVSPAQ